MAARVPLTLAEKERRDAAKLSGRSLASIAAALGCSYQTARQGWRQAPDHGRSAFQQARRGRAAPGVLRRFAPAVTARARALKREHPTWGPDRVQRALQRAPALRELRLPSRRRLAVLFKTACPDLVAPRRPRSPPAAAPPPPTAVHECWQLDCQEAIPRADDHRASMCTIRDPIGAAILTSQAVDVSGATRGRRLTWDALRGGIRSAFARWESRPDGLQTDKEVGLGGHLSAPAARLLRLGLVGLGVQQRFIRPNTPTDQAQIERTHRSLDGVGGLPHPRRNLAQLQQRRNLEREQHTRWFPSRASDGAGRPPLLAHPELLQPRRPYRLACARPMCDLQRVSESLATLRWERKGSSTGQIQLRGRAHAIGRSSAGQIVIVQCDAPTHEWVGQQQGGGAVQRLPISGLDVTGLTGITAVPLPEGPPMQLTLPLVA